MKKETRELKKKASMMNIEEKKKFVYELYSSGTSYKLLACIFNTTVEHIVKYFEHLDVKYCTQCKKLHPRDDFHIASGKTDGLQSHCKVQAHKKRKYHYEKDKKGGIEASVEWKKQNRDHVNWLRRERNKLEENKKKNRDYVRNRANTDPKFRIRLRFGNLISYHLAQGPKRLKKRGRHWEDIVGYTLDELCEHLESQFQLGMTWTNYGEWHVDHIKPASSFDVKEVGDDEFMKCWALDNLQPLWAEDNIAKSDKIVG